MSLIRDKQIEPSLINDYVLATVSGVTQWTPLSAVTGSVEYLNDLLDVTTNLPVLSAQTFADDGRLLHYDVNTQQWISDDIVTHGTVSINAYGNTNIAKGTPVYLTGTFDNDLHQVGVADANNASAMPVIGFAAEALTTSSAVSKHVITFGKLQGVDTTSGGTISGGESWTAGDILYISSTPGVLTTTRPVGATTQIQRIAQVLRVDASGGQLFIFNTARSAGLPNLTQNNVWIGNSDNQPVETGFTINNLTDTSFTSLSNNQLLQYNSGSGNWVNVNPSVVQDGNGIYDGSGTLTGNTIVDQPVNSTLEIGKSLYNLVFTGRDVGGSFTGGKLGIQFPSFDSTKRPQVPLHVFHGTGYSAESTDFWSGTPITPGTCAIFQNDGNNGQPAYITIVGGRGTGGDAGGSGVNFGDSDDVLAGRIFYRHGGDATHSANAMAFYTDATERMRIFNSGNVTIGDTLDKSHKLSVEGSIRINDGTAQNGYVLKSTNSFGEAVWGQISTSAVTSDSFVTNSYLTGTTLVFDRNDSLSAFTVDLSSLPDANGIYGGSGDLITNTNVTMSGYSLSFVGSGINTNISDSGKLGVNTSTFTSGSVLAAKANVSTGNVVQFDSNTNNGRILFSMSSDSPSVNLIDSAALGQVRWSSNLYNYVRSTDTVFGGNGTPSGRVHIIGAGDTSANVALTVENSSNTDLLNVLGDGQVYAYGRGHVTGVDANTGFGEGTFNDSTTGGRQVAIGKNALSNVTTGTENTAIGWVAGNAITVGSRNTLIGSVNGDNITSGSTNTFIGFSVGDAMTTGTYNIGMGAYTMRGVMTGSRNIGIGDLNGASLTSGSFNLLMGYRAGASVSTTSNNIFFGNTAGYLATGDANIGIGVYAGFRTTGNNNVGLGNYALGGFASLATTTNDNIAIGRETLYRLQTGGSNVAVGAFAQRQNQSGGTNTSIGYGAGYTNISGSGNVNVGYYAGYYETGSNTLFIDNQSRGSEAVSRTNSLIYGIFNATPANQRLTFNANVGIGVSAGTDTLRVDGTFRYVDGNEASGYVLTSDASGNATWQAAPSGATDTNYYTTGATFTGNTTIVFDRNDTSNAYSVDISSLISGLTSKYAANVPMTGGTTETVTHSLGTTDITVQVKDSSGTLIIPDVVDNYQTNSVDINVSVTDTYRVIIIG